MARTVAFITSQILDQKQISPELSVLNSGSQTAHWRLWVDIMAFVIWLHEKVWDSHKLELEDIALRAVPGTARWYAFQALEFQYTYSLTWNPDTLKFEYATIDDASKIVKRSAIREAGGLIQLKVAKLTGGVPDKLDSLEKAAFVSYIDDIKFAGTFVQVISEDSDLLNLSMEVYYDPLIPLNILQPNVEDTINAYIQELPFDGELRIINLVDAIQGVEGVKDVANLSASAKYAALPYAPFAVAYESFAGHMKIDPVFPLNGSIVYIPL